MILALLSALIMILAAPPLNWYLCGWIGLVPLIFYLSKGNSPRSDFLAGYAFGFVYLGYLFWGVTELSNFAGFWGFVGYLALVFYYAFFPALFALLIGQAHHKRYYILWVAAGWVLMEYLRSLGPFGATLGAVGYLESHFGYFIQIASVGGVYLLSFLLVLFNAWLAQFLNFKNSRRSGFFILLILIFVFAYGFFRINFPINAIPAGPVGVETNGTMTKDQNSEFTVMIVQPNINQHDKMDGSKSWEILRYIEKLTLTDKTASLEAIIWPETAISEYLFGGSNSYYNELRVFINLLGTGFITGAPYWNGKEAYNSAFSFNNSGEVLSRFDKERLVPFGEYLLFRPIFLPLLGGDGLFSQDFSFGSSNPDLLKIGRAQAATAICFESVYPDLVRDRVNLGGDFILVITNDGWFGASNVAEQHLNIGMIRAVENGRYLVQCGNTGISGFINPNGKLIAKTGLGKAQTLIGQIALLSNRTIYGWVGDWIVWFCGLWILGSVFYLFKRR